MPDLAHQSAMAQFLRDLRGAGEMAGDTAKWMYGNLIGDYNFANKPAKAPAAPPMPPAVRAPMSQEEADLDALMTAREEERFSRAGKTRIAHAKRE